MEDKRIQVDLLPEQLRIIISSLRYVSDVLPYMEISAIQASEASNLRLLAAQLAETLGENSVYRIVVTSPTGYKHEHTVEGLEAAREFCAWAVAKGYGVVMERK